MVAGWIADELGVTAEDVLALAAGDDDPERRDRCSISRTASGRRSSRSSRAAGTDSDGDFVVDGWQDRRTTRRGLQR